MEEDQHQYLIADFEAIKSEIARRSNAQQAAMAAIVAFYAWLLNQIVAQSLTLWQLIAVWVATITTHLFYKREVYEIQRLGLVIRNRIAIPVGAKLGVPPEFIIPSEICPNEQNLLERTGHLDCLFQFIVFVLIPLGLTVVYAFQLLRRP